MILGIDEAGRGPWAGPLVVGAVVLGGASIDGLTDSKKLTKKKRELLYGEIITKATAYASGWVGAEEIDELGMSQALRLATRRAVEKIHVPYSEIIIDGTVNFLVDTKKGRFVQTLTKADLLIPSVSAASIVAKVERDKFMSLQDANYPQYGFKSHSGYGVLRHRQAIEKYGVTPLHRLSFAPLRQYGEDKEEASQNTQTGTTTKQIGDEAESVVADYLSSKGHDVLARNWRTKFCEIDIVSIKELQVYFTEVKYRKSSEYGDGLSAITKKKQKQMRFGAELYLLKNPQLASCSAVLQAADVSGRPPTIQGLVEVDS